MSQWSKLIVIQEHPRNCWTPRMLRLPSKPGPKRGCLIRDMWPAHLRRWLPTRDGRAWRAWRLNEENDAQCLRCKLRDNNIQLFHFYVGSRPSGGQLTNQVSRNYTTSRSETCPKANPGNRIRGWTHPAGQRQKHGINLEVKTYYEVSNQGPELGCQQ